MFPRYNVLTLEHEQQYLKHMFITNYVLLLFRETFKSRVYPEQSNKQQWSNR